MKKVVLIITANFIIAMLVIGCADTTKKDMSDMTTNLKESNQDLKEAVIAINDTIKKNTIANWKSFKRESESAIARMDKDVATLEAKLEIANKATKEKLKMDLEKVNNKLQVIKVKLQQKNTEFESDINKFDKKVASNNQSFQREFNHDMNELTTAFKDLFRDTIK